MRLRFHVLTALSALLVSACAPIHVSSHVQRDLHVTQYRTFDWGAPDALPVGDERLDRNPFFLDHLVGAVEKELSRKGFLRADNPQAADLLIHYHANISQRIDVNRLDRAYGYCYDERCGALVFDYEAGTLVVDIVDAKTNQLIWRGWAEHGVRDVLTDERRMARTINDAVQRMLARFPDALSARGVGPCVRLLREGLPSRLPRPSGRPAVQRPSRDRTFIPAPTSGSCAATPGRRPGRSRPAIRASTTIRFSTSACRTTSSAR
jgi:hypothetical protein